MSKENKGKIVIDLSGDWHYRLDVDVEYAYDCNAYGCDMICRCGTISNSRIEPVAAFKAVELAQSFFQDGAGREGKLGFALATRFLKKLFEEVNDLFEVEICSGYYGEEVEGVFAGSGAEYSLQKQADQFNQRTNSERLMMVLEQEYGSILPEVEQYKEWNLTELLVADVSADKEVLSRCSSRICQEYSWFTPWYRLRNNRLVSRLWKENKEWFPAIVVIPKEKGGYRVIDGFHRYKAWTEKPYGLGQKKWKALRTNKKIWAIVPVV